MVQLPQGSSATPQLTEKYNPSRERIRMRSTSPASQDWEVLQAVVGFAYTIQQEYFRLRRETGAMLGAIAQQQIPTVQPGFSEALQRVVAAAHTLTEASGAAIAIGNDQSMMCVARSGTHAPPLGSRFDSRSGLGGECVRTRQSVICVNAAADPRVDFNACAALDIRSIIYRPLFNGSKIIGVLAVFSSRAQHFSYRDLNCLRWADELVVEALDNPAKLGVGALIRDLYLPEPVQPPSNSFAAAAAVGASSRGMPLVPAGPPKYTPPPAPLPVASAAPAPTVDIPVRTASPVAPAKSVTPDPAPIFVGRIVDEEVAADEETPVLWHREPEKFDSPIPLLVAAILVLAFLVVVGLLSYYRVTPKTNPKPVSPAPTSQTTAPPETPPQPATAPVEKPTAAQPADLSVGAEKGAANQFPTAIAFHSGASVSTMMIALTKPATYQGFQIKNPDRLYFDINGVSLVGPKGASISVNDSLVTRIRISQHGDHATRIVFDLRSEADFRAAISGIPGHLNIELRPKSTSKASEETPAIPTGLTIVIDPGHGGHDNGAISASGLKEKDVSLDLAQRLGKLLEEKLGAKVIYTRTTDDFIPLPTRVNIANESHADFLISIHGNYSTYKSVRGIETFYFQNPQEALQRASENAQTPGSQTDEAARSFAADVHKALYSGLNDGDMSNRGLKTAPFVVLRDARMPAVLAEVAFMSSKKDARRLESSDYREKVARALFQGIRNHVMRRDARVVAASTLHNSSTVAAR